MSHDAGATCMCVAEHRPPVLEYEFHHIWPTALGGSDVDSNIVAVCSNCHTSTHELLRLMFAARRSLSDHELQAIEPRPVSRYAAALAREGFNRWAASAGTP